MKLDFYFAWYKKINSEWVKDLNVSAEAAENIGELLLGNNLLLDFLYMTAKA